MRLPITEPRSVVPTSFGLTVAEIDRSDDGVVSSSLEIGVSTATYWLSCATSVHCKLQVGCLFLNLPKSFLACKYTLQVSLAPKLSAV